MTKIFRLFSFEKGVNYFLRVLDTETQYIRVLLILNVEELTEHAHYQISIMNAYTGDMDGVIIHDTLLTMSNLQKIALNYISSKKLTEDLVERDVQQD